MLNKYYPPDFDPSKIKRIRKNKDDKQIKVRIMLPFSMRCATCGNFIYKGTKFNSRKEDVPETYLGIRIYRFYLRCPRCAGEITMKTDPKNSDYICELGATRNFEPRLEQQRQEEELKRKRQDEEEGDAMRALENRALDSKREMDLLHALDEIKSQNNRNAKIDTTKVIAALHQSEAEEREGDLRFEEEEEAELKDLRRRNVKRIDDSLTEQAVPPSSSQKTSQVAPKDASRNKKRSLGVAFTTLKPKFVAKVVKKEEKEKTDVQQPSGSEAKSGNALAGLMGYGSSDDESD